MGASEGPGRTLFQFVRFWSRRWTGAGVGFDVERGRDVMVAEAVLARAVAGGATINDVAEELGIDQSGASRLVARGVDRGYLVKGSMGDARRRMVQVTPLGSELVALAHDWQEATFAELTVDWTREEIDQFSALMCRLVANRDPGR